MSKQIQVTIKGMDGKERQYDTATDDTIFSLKSQFAANQGNVQPEEIKFIYNGKELSNNLTLADFGIENDSVIHVMMNLKGGEKNCD